MEKFEIKSLQGAVEWTYFLLEFYLPEDDRGVLERLESALASKETEPFKDKIRQCIDLFRANPVDFLVRYVKIPKFLWYGTDREDFKALMDGGTFESANGKWVLEKYGEVYCATWEGAYLHRFSNIIDLLLSRNEVDTWSYSKEASERTGESTFVKDGEPELEMQWP